MRENYSPTTTVYERFIVWIRTPLKMLFGLTAMVGIPFFTWLIWTWILRWIVMPHSLRQQIAAGLAILTLFVLWSFRDSVIFEKLEEEKFPFWRWFQPDNVVVLRPMSISDERSEEHVPKPEVSVQSSRRT